MKHGWFKVRLVVNGIFCAGVLVLFMPVFMGGIMMLLVPNPEWHADEEALKVQVLNLSAGVFVLGATVSLVRTFKRWREVAEAGKGAPDDVA